MQSLTELHRVGRRPFSSHTMGPARRHRHPVGRANVSPSEPTGLPAPVSDVTVAAASIPVYFAVLTHRAPNPAMRESAGALWRAATRSSLVEALKQPPRRTRNQPESGPWGSTFGPSS